MEDPQTPWAIAQATTASGAPGVWAWLVLAFGALIVIAGGILLAVI